MNPPIIPDRKSSKRPIEELEELKARHTIIQTELKDRSKRLKTAGSFDQDYWCQRVAFTDKSLESIRLKKSISQEEFLLDEEGDAIAWQSNAVAKKLRDIEAARAIEKRTYEKQATNVAVQFGDEEKSRRRYLMRLFTSSKRGLYIQGDQTNPGPRHRKTRNKFRKALIEAYKSKKSDKWSKKLWCPVLSEWVDETNINACHIFPKRAGQEDMNEIFGRDDPSHPESDSIENGIILSKAVGQMIDKGKMLIVPDVPQNASQQELNAWIKSSPKEYKTRIVELEDKELR